MDINDVFTLCNTALCCILIILRLFYYRKNPKLDTIIHRLEVYLNSGLESRFPGPARGRPAPCAEAIGEGLGVCDNSNSKSNI